ncbi:hypothetical protein BC938DRAFT_478118 [Jimgerdemannia flammicorona]|uniref:Uncharacterized protein n=1 Tax=Jimgerdemannia flammicorona TaxID=994334 RepID=A0A433QYL7_9FUNG|nr:hypothetical protein BC938DRAFT_478118 [Jimgerdemannia flammicorona]
MNFTKTIRSLRLRLAILLLLRLSSSLFSSADTVEVGGTSLQANLRQDSGDLTSTVMYIKLRLVIVFILSAFNNLSFVYGEKGVIA